MSKLGLLLCLLAKMLLLSLSCVLVLGLQKKTNHSLGATGASLMFSAGVPEKLIESVTGHRSSKALEVYERPTNL